MAWKKMCDTEITLAKRWFLQDSETIAEIAKRLRRDTSTITRLLMKRAPRKAQGRKKAFTDAAVDKLQAKLEALIKKADGKREVAVKMLKKSTRCKFSERTILNALHDRGVYVRPLRQKPVLTDDDIVARKKFADKFAKRPASWWSQQLHLIIDVKHFRVLPHGDARKYAAQESCCGRYRQKGAGACQGAHEASGYD